MIKVDNVQLPYELLSGTPLLPDVILPEVMDKWQMFLHGAVPEPPPSTCCVASCPLPPPLPHPHPSDMHTSLARAPTRKAPYSLSGTSLSSRRASGSKPRFAAGSVGTGRAATATRTDLEFRPEKRWVPPPCLPLQSLYRMRVCVGPSCAPCAWPFMDAHVPVLSPVPPAVRHDAFRVELHLVGKGKASLPQYLIDVRAELSTPHSCFSMPSMNVFPVPSPIV